MNSKKAKNSRLKLIIAALSTLVLLLTFGIVMAFAGNDSIVTVGEMAGDDGIYETFKSYLVQDTQKKSDDYVGSVQYTAYYDTSKGEITSGYEGTPVVIYSVNHPGIERIGTDSNATIIQSMLDRGYVVVVLDYLENNKAVSPAIDYSAQTFRTAVRKGQLLKTSVFPSGELHENFLAPSGYNVILNEVFWEIDKHSASGTLEKIVENWNSDFKATKGGKLVKWVHEDGTRKTVAVADDGTSPKWYNASGKEDANGEYTYIKYTVAETITDCVDPDGSFIDMNLYINIAYPTNPEKEVPVTALANSSGYPTTSVTSADPRAHSAGFLYNGYVNLVFDYLWVPMARSASWGYYDGSAGITQDHMNYGLMMYNDKLVNTAAMRYLRYLSVNGGNTFKFDLDKFFVYGNSKGGWFSFLGEEVVQSTLANGVYANDAEKIDAIDAILASFTPHRYFNGKDGQTRYQLGEGSITKDGFTVNAGEAQPWLLYSVDSSYDSSVKAGQEIISGIQLGYASNGSQQEDITAGHTPMIIASHMYDDYNAAYGYSNDITNICRELGITLIHFEVPLGHTLTYGPDMNHGADTYKAVFDYIGYFLKGEALEVIHVEPLAGEGKVALTSKILIQFAGDVGADEITKVTVTGGGETLSGTWTTQFGGTEWIFTPDNMKGNTEYTVTVPAGLKGNNGSAVENAYTSTFVTDYDKVSTEMTLTESDNGNYYSFTAPALTNGNGFVFRFRTNNDAANTVSLYAVDSTASYEGTLLGSVRVHGEESYEIDISDYIAANADKNVVLLLKADKAAGGAVVTNETFDTYKPSNSKLNITTGASIDGKTALKISLENAVTVKGVSKYYPKNTHLFTYGKVTGTSASSIENYGRRYLIELDIYDTISRTVQFKLNSMTKREAYGTIDYNNIFFAVTTTANDWTHVSFIYEVYEPDYGKPAVTNVQSLAIFAAPDGTTGSPFYFDDLIVTELTTDVEFGYAAVAEVNTGLGEYKAPESETPLHVYNGETLVGSYNTWKDAFANYKSGYTITLKSDYTLTDDHLTSAISGFETVNINLNGYTIASSNTKNSLLWAKAANKDKKTYVNVYGGSILLGATPLVSYEGGETAASGKEYVFNITNVDFALMDKASATEIISAASGAESASESVTIKFNGCDFIIDNYKHAYDDYVILPGALTKELNLKYEVSGGSFYINSQRRMQLLDNAKSVNFVKNSEGNYTSLYAPVSVGSINGSYLIPDGYASYKATGNVENSIAEYTLVLGEGSTRYGVIDEAYMDKNVYPFAVFKDGVMIGGFKTYKDAIAAASAAVKGTEYIGSQVEVVLRRDYKTDGDEATFGSNAGTILIDLGGNTLTRGSLLFNFRTDSSNNFTYDINVTVINGRLETNGGCLGATHHGIDFDGVRTFNLTFEGITIGFEKVDTVASSKSEAFWASSWNNKHFNLNTTVNIILNDATIDLTAYVPTTTTLFGFGTNAANHNLYVNGGQIVGNGKGVTLAKCGTMANVMAGRGSDGEYVKFVSENGGTAPEATFLCEDGKYKKFVLNETSGEYELKVDELVTPYGVITSQYADAAKYPFALFDANGFVGAYTHWANTADTDKSTDHKDLIHAAKDKITGANGVGKTVYVYLRRDYALDSTEYSVKKNSSGEWVWENESFNNLSQVTGTLVVDLGTNTLTLGAKPFLPSTAKAQNSVIYDSAFEFKNGSIDLNSMTLINYGTSSSLTSSKSFDYTFTNVDFVFGTSGSSIIKRDGGFSGTAVLNADIVFDNCTFDFTKITSSSSNYTLFDVNNSKLAAVITVKGGEMISNATAMSKVTFTNLGSVGTLDLVAGEDGKYITLTYPTADTASNKVLAEKDGNMYFVEVAEDAASGMSTYEAMYYKTAYGTATVSTSNLSAIDYPFFVFSGGSYVDAFSTWKKAVEKAKTLSATAGVESQIVLRRDYNTVYNDNSSLSDASTNFNTAKGLITVDLNGYTIKAENSYLIDIYVNYSSAGSMLTYASSIKFENGTIISGNSGKTGTSVLPAIGIGGTNTNASYGKKVFNFSFENITFKSVGARPVLQTWNHTFQGIEVNVEANGCTFDFTGMAADNTFFNFESGKTYTVVNATINGGTVIVDVFNNYSIYTSDSDDTVKFGTVNNVYLTLVQDADAAAPSALFESADGKTLSFIKEGNVAGRVTYVLAGPITTPYGDIPASNQSVELYPFVVFSESGKFLGAYNVFYGANASASAIGRAKDYLSANVWNGTSYGANEKSVVIMMRRDYALGSGEYYDNLSQVQGTITIDLCGYKLTSRSDKTLFAACIKPWSGSGDAKVFPSTIEVINGSVALGSKSLVDFSAWDGDNGTDVSNKAFTFNFNSVKFDFGTASTCLASLSQHSGSPEAIANSFMNFTNCEFTVKAGKTLVKTTNGYTTNKVCFDGCKINAYGAFVLADNYDNITFAKTNYYTTISLPSGTECFQDSFNTKLDGTAHFVKTSDDGDKAVYTICPDVLKNFVPMSSITLDAAVIYNVYVPAKDLVSFSFDGHEYDISTLEKVVLESGEYYLASVTLASSEAARNMVLTATISIESGNVTGRWTMNVPKYAELALAAENTSEEEATLIRDVLSYIKAAYKYFTGKNTQAEIDRVSALVDSIIGADYDANNLPKTDGEAKTPASGKGIIGATMNLGQIPSFIFYLSEDADANSFVFSQDGKRLAKTVVESEDGDYIVVTMYAYRMGKTVSYTGTENGETVSGSYNIEAYYADKLNTDDALLISLVERFMKYCQSADAYREYYIANN